MCGLVLLLGTKGLLSLMKESGKDADILFMGHVGYDDAAEIPAILKGNVFNSPLSCRVWRLAAEEIPEDEEGKVKVFLEKWKEMDEWCYEERQLQLKDPVKFEQNLIELEATSQMYLK